MKRNDMSGTEYDGEGMTDQNGGQGTDQCAASGAPAGNGGAEAYDASVKRKVASGTAWLFLEKAGLSVFEFAVAWVLARFFLTPNDYALVGICAIFIAFANLFSQGSFNLALIQKKELKEKDPHTVFWMSLGVSAAFYAIFFFAAPAISSLYNKAELINIIRILGLSMIFDSFATVQTALLTREMRFKKIFVKTFIAAAVSGAAGITCAAMGLGVYALVVQAVVLSFTGALVLFIITPWKPSFKFSAASVREMGSFGVSMFTSNVVNNAYTNALPLLMEKVYAGDTLGYYNKAKTIPTKIGEAINSTISGIAFPSLSAYQSEPQKAKALLRKFISVSSFVMFAAMAGLFAVSEPLTLFIYTDKWAGSIVFMRFVCVTCAFLPVNSANLQAIKAFGKGETYLVLELIKNALGVAMIAGGMILTRGYGWSLYAMLGIQIVVSLVCVFINTVPNKKLIGYTIKEMLSDIMPQFILAIVMCAAAYSVTFIGLSSWLTLLIQIPLGIAVYFGGAMLFRMKSMKSLVEFAGSLIKKRRNAKKHG